MANEFEAKVDIDASAAERNLKAIDKSVAGLDRTLKSLDGSLKRIQGTLSASSRAMQESTRANTASATAANRTAQAAERSARARELDSRAALNQARTAALQTRAQQNATRASQSAANSFQAVTGAVTGFSAGANAAMNANGALAGSMSNTRYLLYDIGATYRAISIALLALPIATTTVAASFEKSFAQVERTTGGASASTRVLRDDIKELGETIPVAFGDLTKITALGAQLGVATEDLSAFTEVVAKFSASTGVAAEEAGAAFGRIGSAFGLGAGEYEKLGSAIAKVGVSSAATESEIIAITQQLAPLASLAGFSAQEVVGLSGALASMRIRPELARGAFQSTIFKITEATENGGKSLQAYANIMGKTGDEVKALFKTDPAKFFTEYIAGIGKAMENGQSFSSILDTLGVKEKRERQFILAMANQYGFLGDQIDLANKSYADGTFLNDASAPVFQTLAANLQKLGNSLANLGDSLGGQTVIALSALVETVAAGANSFSDFVDNTPGMKEILGVLIGFGAIAGIFFAIRAAMAFVLAALVGFQQVAGRSAITTTLGFRGIAAQAAVTRLVTQGATAQMAADYVRMAGTVTAMSARVQTANNGMATSIVRTGGAIKGFSTLALSAVGGLPGLIVGALTVIGLGFLDAKQKAEQAGKAIATAMKTGGAEGLKAAADALKEIKAEAGSGLEFGSFGKDVPTLAKEVGIGFESVLAAVMKGKAGVKEFDKAVDDFARSKGYADLQDMSAKNPFKWTEGGQEVAKLDFLKKKVAEVAAETDSTTKTTKTAEEAVKKLGGEGAEAMLGLKEGAEEGGSAFENLSQNIKDAADQIFGLTNAESAAEAALFKLGESLAASNDLSIGTEGGRENIDNAQTAVVKYAEAISRAQAEGVITAQQAAADYAGFLSGLFDQLVARGVDPAQAQQFIDQAKGIMSAQAAAGGPVNVPVGVDAAQAQTAAGAAIAGVEASVNATVPTVIIDGDGTRAGVEAEAAGNYVRRIVDEPYEIGVDADVDPVIGNTDAAREYVWGFTSTDWTAQVNANTSPAIANLQNLMNFANSVISSIQWAINTVTGNMGSAASRNVGAEIGNVRTATKPAASAQPSAPTVQSAPAPSQIPSVAPQAKALGSLGDGYDKVKDAAKKAGDAGKKAGKDMADGIDEADAAVADYAQRLKTGLTAAFDRQYGLTSATDEYHSALNAINKKREDELETIQDLVDKQKELNIARQGDLVAARKAMIEAEISQKYGEVDRAADYRQQAEEANNAAAEKQKNIDTARKEQTTLQAGVGALDGYSDAAIANRAALRDLESKMLDMVVAYAATGASQEQVRAYSQKLSAQFQTDATNAYGSRVQITALTGDMGRYVTVINSVPARKNTVMTADVSGALSGADVANRNLDYAARNRVSHVYTQYHGSLEATGNTTANNQPTYRVINPDGTRTNNILFNRGGGVTPMDGYASGGLIPGTPPSNPREDNMLAMVDNKKRVMVRSGEFIQPEEAVNYYGADYMEAIRRMQLPKFNTGGGVNVSASGRGNSDGPMLVELTADNIRAILALGDRPVDLYAGVEKLASSVNDGNKILASKGVKIG